MASIEKRVRGGKLSWRAHYRDPSGNQRNKSFPRKVDAERFLTSVENSKLLGSYIDPAVGRLSVGELSRLWLGGQSHLKPSTLDRYTGILRRHIVPRWGQTRLSDVTHSAVQTWIAELSSTAAPATVHKIHNVLSLVLSLAVRDGRLARNPAGGVNLPRVEETERRFLTHSEVRRVAEAAGSYRIVVLFLAYTGVRFGEMAALRVGQMDLLRGRATISASVTEVNGKLSWGTPKSHGRREVPMPRFIVDDLMVHLAGKRSDDLAFPGLSGVPLRIRVFRGPFERALGSAGIERMRPHDLRHTAASLAIASGANVKVVQQMLGHKSAIMTLDLYGHLFPDQLDDVGERLDTAARAADVAPALPASQAVALESVRRTAGAQ